MPATFKNHLAAKRKRNLASFRLMSGNLDWIEDNSPSAPALVALTGVIDGANADFTLPSVPTKGILLFNNGLYQYLNLSYTIAGAVVTFQPGYVPQSTGLPDQILAVIH